MAKTYTKVLKDGKIHFYTGNKKSTDTQAKQFIKENYTNFGKGEKLDAKQRQYLGQVKGGKARYENSLTDKSGRYLPKATQERAFKLVDIPELMKGGKYDTIRGYLKENPFIAEQFENIINQTGIHTYYNSHEIFDKIKTFKGKNFEVNGKATDKKNMIRRIRTFASELKRNYTSMDFSIKLSYVGVDKIKIEIPTPSFFPEGSDEFNEIFGREGEDICEVYVSEPNNDKKKRKKKAAKGKGKKSTAKKSTAKKVAHTKRKYSSKKKKK